MQKNVFAWTDTSHPYPAFVSINKYDGGIAKMTARGPAKDGLQCGETIEIVLSPELINCLNDDIKRQLAD